MQSRRPHPRATKAESASSQALQVGRAGPSRRCAGCAEDWRAQAATASAHHLHALQMLQADLFPCEVWFLTFGLFPGKEQYICF